MMVRVSSASEISVDELFATSDDPFIRHQVIRATTKRAWRRGRAVVISGGRGRPEEIPAGPVYTCLGPRADLGPLMRDVAATAESAWRVTNESAADDVVPEVWRRPAAKRWHWMLTTEPPPVDSAQAVEEVTDTDEINAVLDQAIADSHARPTTPGIEVWLGVRRDSRLLGVGALIRLPDGTGHLRGVGVSESSRGHGIGTAISAALTRRGFVTGAGLCTLGVYTDNAPAIAMYASLGYRVHHTFTAGAVDPSR